MKKRSRAGGEPTKGRRGNAPEPKGRNAVKALARSNSPSTNKVDEFARLARELGEALDRQTATTELLQAINNSHGDLQPVFQTMLAKAVRLCQATFGVLWLAEGDRFRSVALHNLPPAFAAARQGEPVVYFGPKSGTGRLIEKKQIFQIEDLRKDRGYIERDPRIIPLVELGGARTALFAPLLQENHVIGSLVLYRQEVCPFGDKQIALVENFAAQAVIAIENARLLNELQRRTSDLAEALEQQTASAEVLSVISGSPGNLKAVFQAMLNNAARLCEASVGTMYLREGDAFRTVGMHGASPSYLEARLNSLVHPSRDTALGKVELTKRVAQIEDAAAGQAYAEGDPIRVSAVDVGGIRTVLCVPMLKKTDLIGAIAVYRREVRPFTEKQIGLLSNFAAQAVIAIENARLLSELRQRTEEVEKLNKHLEQRVTAQVDEIERMSRLRRFLPPQVADLIVASGSEKQLESHRREITALFCDLRGFTGFSESADPEDVMALLRDYHAAIGQIINKYGGTLERYAGDGVMVVFNDPVPVENPALQAVLMALEMRDAIGALTETWRRWGHEIGFGIGIAHGFATLGTIGFEGRFDYAAIGTVSNVASRLCDEAKPGQILISPRVLTKVENAVTVEPVGEFELKGIRRPLAAYNVVATVSE